MRLALVAVAALAVAAAACGGVESEPNLAKAAERTEDTGSFAFEMTARETGEGTEVELSCDGAVDSARKRYRFTCEDSYVMLTVDGTTYVDDGATDGKWWKVPAEDEDSLDHIAPERMLGVLRTASRKTERIGEEEVRGVSTVHYALTVDCEAAADFFSCERSTEVVDVWIDDEGLVRRIATESPTTASFEFFDFGEPVDIEPPTANQVKEMNAPFRCNADEAKPITVERALDALRGAGFRSSVEEGSCSGSVAALISDWGAGAHSDELFCYVLTGAVRVSADGLTVGSGAGDPPRATRNYENFQCALYADGANADDAIGRLDRAFAELRREFGG